MYLTAQECAVSTHSRPKAAGNEQNLDDRAAVVSTHSRPKAAGTKSRSTAWRRVPFQHTAARRRLVRGTGRTSRTYSSFNTQPPEGGWNNIISRCFIGLVSTHSRPKAAGFSDLNRFLYLQVSTHSRPKAAGFTFFTTSHRNVCFNTQPPEGGWVLYLNNWINDVSFNTQPPEGGWLPE